MWLCDIMGEGYAWLILEWVEAVDFFVYLKVLVNNKPIIFLTTGLMSVIRPRNRNTVSFQLLLMRTVQGRNMLEK